MAKQSKNQRTNRGQNTEEKNMVKVIKPVKSKTGRSYAFREKIVHKDKVQEYLNN